MSWFPSLAKPSNSPGSRHSDWLTPPLLCATGYLVFFISENELQGDDRAEYGAKAFKEIIKRLEKKGFNQLHERHLYLCKDFYLAYPNILRLVTAKFIDTENIGEGLKRSVYEIGSNKKQLVSERTATSPEQHAF